jgi:chromate transport protein ChrA
MLARYVLNPVIALLVGTCVGALAKSRAGVLAVLGLVPWALGFLFAQRQDTSHFLVLGLFGLLYLLIGAAAARTTFRMRTRSAANDLARI